MAHHRVVCPECGVTLELGKTLAPGKRLRCPKCEAVFTASPPESDSIHDDAPVRPRRRFKKKNRGMAPAAIAGMVAIAFMFAVGAAVAGYLIWKPAGKAGGPVAGRGGTTVGQLAQEIEGEDIDGKVFKLSDYRGKVVVLDFWGHW